MQNRTWTQEEIDNRLDAVRKSLLRFLRERHRLDWFKHKIRWQISRKFIWPGRPEERDRLLEEAVEGDVSIEAFRDYLQKQQRTISDAIERYNHAVRRQMEEAHGKPASQFDLAAKEELAQRRITFQGIRDELRRRAKDIKADSDPQVLGELLSLRLGILTEDVRDEIFGEVAAHVADEVCYALDEPCESRKRLVAFQTELWLRCLDQYYVTRLLAENYAEARRLMGFERLFAEYQEALAARDDGCEDDPIRTQRMETLRGVLLRYVSFLEQFFPASAGTHGREGAALRAGFTTKAS